MRAGATKPRDASSTVMRAATLSLIILIGACGPREGPAELSHDGLLAGHLTADVIADDPSLALPTDITVLGEYVVFIDIAADSAVHAIDRTAGTLVAQFGRKGGGPGEFTSPWTLDAAIAESTLVWVFDAGLGRLSLADLTAARLGERPVIRETIALDADVPLFGPVWVSNQQFMSLGIFHRAGRIALFDRRGRRTASFGSLPPTFPDVPINVQQQVYQGTLVVHPDRHLIASVTRRSGRIEVYSTAGETLAVRDGPLTFDPSFSVHQTEHGPVMGSGRDHRFGYVDATGSREHIVALFSGRTRAGFPGEANFGQYLHLFDWNGNFQTAFKLDRAVLTIAVDVTGSDLYAVRHSPRPQIVRYRLPVSSFAAAS